MNRTHTIATVSALTLLATAGLLLAGPLNPPAGPVTSSYKTLTEVEPRIAINATNTPGDADSVFKITSPGSYYLTSQVTIPPGKRGIEIDADGVTIDLSGFRVGGFAGSLDGISTTGSQRHSTTIKNGTVGPLSGTGIVLGPAGDSSRASRIEGVTVVDCSDNGLYVDRETVISRCVVSGCGTYGIYVSLSAIVSDCTVSTCNTGLLLSNDGVVERCLVSDCNLDGILVGGHVRVVDNTCNGNGIQTTTGAGIHVFGSGTHGAVIRSNHCAENDRGIWVEGTGTVIVGNTCYSNPMVIAAGNYYGPVIDRLNSNTPAMSGTFAPSTLGTTDPNANIVH